MHLNVKNFEGLLMLTDVVFNTIYSWTVSQRFVRDAEDIDQVNKIEISEEITVRDDSVKEENMKGIAGIIGRKKRF